QKAGLHARLPFEGQDKAARFVWNTEGGGEVFFFLHSTSGAPVSPEQIFLAQMQFTDEKVPPLAGGMRYLNPISKDIVLVLDVPAAISGLAMWNKTGDAH